MIAMMPFAETQAATEHPVVPLVRFRAMRKALWMRELWAREPVLGHKDAIQHEEVDRILSNPTELACQEDAFYGRDAESVALTRAIREATETLDREVNWRRLVEVFALTSPEQQLLSLALSAQFDPSLGRVFAYLHDQPEMTHATPWLAAALYGPGAEPFCPANESATTRWHLLFRAQDAILAQGLSAGWAVDPGIAAWLAYGGQQDLPRGAACRSPESFQASPVLYPEVLADAMQFLGTVNGSSFEIELIGSEGSGRAVLAGQIASQIGKSLVAVAESDLLEGVPDAESPHHALIAARSARLRDAILYWRESRESDTAACRALQASGVARIAGRSSPRLTAPRAGSVFRSFDLPTLRRGGREQLWHVCSRLPVPWQVRDWLLSPGEIAQLAQVALAGEAAIRQACRRPAESLNLLVRLPLPFEPDDLILPLTVQEAINDFENQVRLRWDVYEQWGFERLCPDGRGLIALLAGPSGTGKTMAAQVLARRLGLELYRLDPAQVINKYIGETEKRLKTIFDECDRAHFMLLIDECEGMFGQRFSSKDAHDRYANLEINYLLQRLERFQGVAVLSTNRKGDMDSGFLRRLRCVIDFMPPGPEERAKLWQNALPATSPSGEELLQAVDWKELANRVALTGADIKLAALNAAFLARAGNERIGMPHILKAVRGELAKKGQTLRGFE
jgi:hypothetical protein